MNEREREFHTLHSHYSWMMNQASVFDNHCQFLSSFLYCDCAYVEFFARHWCMVTRRACGICVCSTEKADFVWQVTGLVHVIIAAQYWVFYSPFPNFRVTAVKRWTIFLCIEWHTLPLYILTIIVSLYWWIRLVWLVSLSIFMFFLVLWLCLCTLHYVICANVGRR